MWVQAGGAVLVFRAGGCAAALVSRAAALMLRAAVFVLPAALVRLAHILSASVSYAPVLALLALSVRPGKHCDAGASRWSGCSIVLVLRAVALVSRASALMCRAAVLVRLTCFWRPGRAAILALLVLSVHPGRRCVALRLSLADAALCWCFALVY
jgi:hypothetical protein